MAKENIRKQLEYYMENDDDAIKFLWRRQLRNGITQLFNLII